MELKINKEWLLRMAEKEGNGIVSVGGLVAQVEANNALAKSPLVAERSALAQLVELQRRKLQLTMEALAKKADVETEEVLAIETGEQIPEPRTVFNLAHSLNLPANKLMHLAGLVVMKDEKLEKAAVRFAARSASIELLTPEEASALDEFVRILDE